MLVVHFFIAWKREPQALNSPIPLAIVTHSSWKFLKTQRKKKVKKTRKVENQADVTHLFGILLSQTLLEALGFPGGHQKQAPIAQNLTIKPVCQGAVYPVKSCLHAKSERAALISDASEEGIHR